MEGFIKIHRQIVEWEWYTDGNTYRLFTHLLYKANHKDGKWRGQEVKRGQLITGRFKLAEELGLTEQQIRTSINKLKSTNEVTSKSTNKNSIITLLNYNLYQDNNQQLNQQVTNKQPTNNQQVTTNKNDNNKKNVKNEKKSKYGEYKNILLTLFQKKKFIKDFGINTFDLYIKKLDEYIQMKGVKYKDHNLVMRKWLKEGDKKEINNIDEIEQKIKTSYYLKINNKVLCKKIDMELKFYLLRFKNKKITTGLLESIKDKIINN